MIRSGRLFQRSRTRLVCLCLVVLLSITVAGCIGDDDVPAPDVGPGVALVVEPEYRLQLEGAAGDWVFVYLPYVNATGDLDGEWEWDVRTSPEGGSAHHVVWMPPTWIDGERGRLGFLGEHHVAPVEDGAYEDRQSWSWGFGTSGDPMIGENFAFGSDAAWELDVRLEIESGAAGYGQPVVIRGTNASAVLVDPGEILLGMDPAGTYAESGSFAADGWRIATFIEAPIQPIAVRDYSIEIPEGSVGGLGTQRGVQAVVFGSASSSNMMAGIGAFDGKAGDWSVSVTYAEAKWDLPFIVFDLPGGGDWPERAQTPYQLRSEAFYWGLTPPLPPLAEDVWFESNELRLSA